MPTHRVWPRPTAEVWWRTGYSIITPDIVSHLVDSLVCKSARPRDHSDAALLVDVAGHDADLAGARGDDAGAVGADEAGLALTQQGVLHLHHVLLGDACDVTFMCQLLESEQVCVCVLY